MGDQYQEILIKKESKSTDVLIKAALVALTVLLVLGGLFISFFLIIPAIAAGFGTYWISGNLDLEYEYLYVNGDIDVDKIMRKEKRKRLGSFPLTELEIAAPTGSHELDSYLNKAKILDYTSGRKDVPSWSLVYHGENETRILVAELNDATIHDLKKRAPRKVSGLFR